MNDLFYAVVQCCASIPTTRKKKDFFLRVFQISKKFHLRKQHPLRFSYEVLSFQILRHWCTGTIHWKTLYWKHQRFNIRILHRFSHLGSVTQFAFDTPWNVHNPFKCSSSNKNHFSNRTMYRLVIFQKVLAHATTFWLGAPISKLLFSPAATNTSSHCGILTALTEQLMLMIILPLPILSNMIFHIHRQCISATSELGASKIGFQRLREFAALEQG